MFEHIHRNEALRRAFQRVKHNKGCPGIDQVSIARYEEHLERNLGELARLLESGTYRPLPARRVYIPKANGKKRPLGIPAIRDRVAQAALLEVLEPIFEPLFADASYGFRPNRSAVAAIEKVQEFLTAGYPYVVEIDIKDFFGTLNHDILLAKLRKHVADARVLGLIRSFLKAGVMEEGRIQKSISGTPQGGLISPLLANVMLNDFDHSIGRTDWKLVRYADDMVVLCKSVNQAVQAMKRVRWMLQRLKLDVAPEKTRTVEHRRGFEFLGYYFRYMYGRSCKGPAAKATNALKERVRFLTRRQQPRNIKQVIEQVNPLVRGWGQYFRHGTVKKRFAELDGWVRMRLRAFIEKKKRSRGNVWYPNDHFKSLGLVCLAELLCIPQQPQLSSIFEQPYRRAGYGKPVRPVR